MKIRSSLFVAVVSVSAAITYYLASTPTPPKVAALFSKAKSAILSAPLTQSAVRSVSVPFWREKSSTVQAAAPVEAVGGPLSLLLRERVVIMHGGPGPTETLPAGTPVRLVREEGSFLRVRHNQNEVIIPHSSVISGVQRLN